MHYQKRWVVVHSYGDGGYLISDLAAIWPSVSVQYRHVRREWHCHQERAVSTVPHYSLPP